LTGGQRRATVVLVDDALARFLGHGQRLLAGVSVNLTSPGMELYTPLGGQRERACGAGWGATMSDQKEVVGQNTASWTD
jgi:hypothetical protein